ncbi:MAG TPA: amidohydrolase, partial [Flavisolibacter sp.]|nr:amidohydrolase [Flavisolibacter sp.]
MTRNGFTLFLCGMALFSATVQGQTSFPENGVADPRYTHYAFTGATIVKDAATTITNGTMVIKDGKIVAVGQGLKVPPGAIEVNAKGKYIYPSFIDIYSDYGTPAMQVRQGGFDFFARPQITSNTKGAYGWNQAIRPEVDAYKIFAADEAKAKALRDLGFGTVLTHVKDGIARGTGSIVTLANDKENLVMLKQRASAHYSFTK